MRNKNYHLPLTLFRQKIEKIAKNAIERLCVTEAYCRSKVRETLIALIDNDNKVDFNSNSTLKSYDLPKKSKVFDALYMPNET